MEETIKYRVIYTPMDQEKTMFSKTIIKGMFSSTSTEPMTYRQALDAYEEIIRNQKVEAKVSIERVYEEMSFRKSIY